MYGKGIFPEQGKGGKAEGLGTKIKQHSPHPNTQKSQTTVFLQVENNKAGQFQTISSDSKTERVLCIQNKISLSKDLGYNKNQCKQRLEQECPEGEELQTSCTQL